MIDDAGELNDFQICGLVLVVIGILGAVVLAIIAVASDYGIILAAIIAPLVVSITALGAVTIYVFSDYKHPKPRD